MKTLIHPAGYAVTVVSWENDADYYATKTVNGLSETNARIIVEVTKLFRNDWKYDTVRGETSFENMYEPTGAELGALYKAVFAIIGDEPFFQVVLEWDDYVLPTEDDEDCLGDSVHELLYMLGLSGMQENQYSRVAESITVHYYAEPVYVEDVTTTFI